MSSLLTTRWRSMATGFLTAGVFPTQITESEFERTRYDQLDDMVATTGVAFLGLTVGCARCHDHKYDPLSSHEYYQLASVFTSTVRSELPLDLSALADGHHSTGGPVPVQVSSEGLKPVKNHADGRGYPHFYPHTYVLKRGDPAQKEGIVSPGFPAVLVRGDADETTWQVEPPEDWRTSYRRRALAAWLTDAEQGSGHLLARVIVNRLWQHHFGRGIVVTPNDFGLQGQRPTHPELLDWLAAELIRHQWRLAPIHRLIMTSSTYRQQSAYDEHDAAIDPENKYLWRYPLRRLEAEAIRDTMLAVSDTLDTSMYGPGTLDEATRRRSVYFTVKRSRLIPTMQLFDSPECLVSMGTRSQTTTAPQALMLLNSAVARQAARDLAERLTTSCGNAVEAAIEEAYQRTLARQPTAEEVAAHRELIEADLAECTLAEEQARYRAALTNFCQLLMCLNEFVYVE